ncbi:uncharacterized protein LOC119069435 [Bradysia coprophila]|uniref:uncharacterized protein LOC119069435 n=1 Tax=Bradysia coprophila TaxID=38358 RepID=UPI00187DBF54|nr:uncharacterized protein LOC119069435 [Bradysia coprophila]
MKHQQVVVDYTVMIKSCLTCLMLAFSGYILIRLICTIFVLPKWIQKQQELEDLKLQNEAMAIKTKKFVQFLSAESAESTDKCDADENNLENVVGDSVEENENASPEEKKDK